MKKIFCMFFLLVYMNCITSLCNNNINVIPESPIVESINWKEVLFNICYKDLILDSVKDNGILLVNIIKNNTNKVLPINRITNELIECISEINKKFNTISMEKLCTSYRDLGISFDNDVNSYASAINIAYYLRSDYLLYSSIYGDLDLLFLKFQLILVKTGEIIFTVVQSI